MLIWNVQEKKGIWTQFPAVLLIWNNGYRIWASQKYRNLCTKFAHNEGALYYKKI